jgi:hypothetical protein
MLSNRKWGQGSLWTAVSEGVGGGREGWGEEVIGEGFCYYRNMLHGGKKFMQ